MLDRSGASMYEKIGIDVADDAVSFCIIADTRV